MNAFSNQDNVSFLYKIFVTISLLTLYRFGSYIPMPGLYLELNDVVSSKNYKDFIDVLNILSGGNLTRMSIFVLAITPYISASIIIQISSKIYKSLENLKKEEGESGRIKIAQLTKYLTLVLAVFQAYGISMLFSENSSVEYFANRPYSFNLMATITFTTGAIAVMWIGDIITNNGIGSGSSLIIFLGIVAGLPSAIINFFELLRKGAVDFSVFSLSMLILILISFIVLALEQANRKILVNYPKRQLGNKIFAANTTNIPLKINGSGVIAPIFANSLLALPGFLAPVLGNDNGLLNNILYYLGRGKMLYTILLIVFIMYFSFMYTLLTFNSQDTAKQLNKHGAYIAGIKPGQQTADYFEYVLTRLAVVGGFYLSIICVLPEMIHGSGFQFFFSGTTILITINVALDTFSQAQSQLFTKKYATVMQKMKHRIK